MPRSPISFEGRPLLDIASYARRGGGRRDRLSPAEIEHISLTVHRTPEVMVKVLTRGGQDIGAVRRHFEYLNRKGELEIETDDGQRLADKGVEKDLVDDWDLDIEEDRRSARLDAKHERAPPKLVHKVLFSMPPGTPPQNVLEAVKNFAREEFGFKHRYAMVLHTDEPHPHVHMVIKAVSEQGKRLNIRKATLRAWRAEFARQLRVLGVPANATERQIRGESRPQKSDGIFRAGQRGQSTHLRERLDAVARQVTKGQVQVDPGKAMLVQTRKEVLRGWQAAAESLVQQGHRDLAEQARLFANQMLPPLSEQEWTARQIVERAHESRVREGPIS